jgi:hypothetical protein
MITAQHRATGKGLSILSNRRSTGGRGSKGITTRHVDKLREKIKAGAAAAPAEGKKKWGFKPGYRYNIVADMAEKLEAYIEQSMPGISYQVARIFGARFIAYLPGGGERWSVWLTDGRRADVTLARNLGEIEGVEFTSGPDPDRPDAFR